MKSNESIIFIGRSGSGKGTQIELLREYISSNKPEANIFYFGSGEHFREFVKKEGYTSELMRDIIASGSLAPDFITEWLLVDAFVKNIQKEDQLMILDGFPRTLDQAHTLDSAMDYYKRDHVHVVHIDVSADEVRTRMMARDRSDDSSETIEKRIAWYNENVLPTLEYFRNSSDQYVVHDINGEQTPDQVHQDILSALNL